jgi:hypothetical protein
MRALLAVAAAVWVAACSAQPERCKVQCGPSGDCPEGTACGADLYCYASDDHAGLCTASAADASSLPGDPDAAGVPPDAGALALALDQPCTDGDVCAGDLVCADYGVGGSHCKATCAGPDDCPGVRSRCSRTDVDSGDMLCSSNCNPLGSGDCADGEKCLLGRAADDLLDVNCAAHGGKALLDPCTISADCGPGLICVGTAPSKVCRQLCVVGSTSCGTGASCPAVAGENQLGGVDYSYCQPSV